MVGEREYKLFDADFATVNPYLGSDGVVPFLKVCDAQDKGIFVLVKTSNPSSGEFQDRPVLVRAEEFDEDGDGSIDTAFFTGKKSKGDLSLRALCTQPGRTGFATMCFARCMRLWRRKSPVGAGTASDGKERLLRGGCSCRRDLPGDGKGAPEDHAALLHPGSRIWRPGWKRKGPHAFLQQRRTRRDRELEQGIIAAYKQEPYCDKYMPENFADASRAAVKAMRKDIREAIG